MQVRFDLSAARDVPVKAGCPVVWRGNVVHWGGRCGADAARPRISLGVTFRAREGAADGAAFSGGACIDLSKPCDGGDGGGPALHERLSLVCRSIVLYSQWFPLNADLVPPVFHRAAARAAAAAVAKERS